MTTLALLAAAVVHLSFDAIEELQGEPGENRARASEGAELGDGLYGKGRVLGEKSHARIDKLSARWAGITVHFFVLPNGCEQQGYLLKSPKLALRIEGGFWAASAGGVTVRSKSSCSKEWTHLALVVQSKKQREVKL